MNRLFRINNKDIYEINTTILYYSSFNFNKDAIELLNNNCEVIAKNVSSNLEDISENTLKYFGCIDLLEKKNLTKIDEIKINILNNITTDKKIVVFLDILTYLEQEFKNKVIEYLKNKNKIIINYTSEIEETLLLEYLIVLSDNKIAMEGLTNDILKEEKILKKLGYGLPFITELSNGLKYYNLIDQDFYTNESLVGELWK